MASGEFSLIEHCVLGLNQRPDPGVVLGPGDDGALVQALASDWLCATTDAMVEGIHFPPGTPPEAVGHRALAINLSDIAAMGSRPRFALLALTMPCGDAVYLARLFHGLMQLAQRHEVALIGGNLSRGPLNATITALGAAEGRKALRRGTARAGDLLAVTGTLGDATLGRLLLPCSRPQHNDPMLRFLLRRYLYPEPRIREGLALRDLVHAAIDLSDGLIQDCGHLCRASGLGAIIHAERLPRSRAFEHLADQGQWLELPLAGGDDYELLLAIPARNWPQATAALSGNMAPLTIIGHLEAGCGVEVHHHGARFAPSAWGHDHFRAF